MASKAEFLTVGREGDETLIDGASPWATKWESASNSAFIGRHASYPGHGYVVHAFRMTANGKTIWFWAGRIEEGVWAFYR